ncbi:MAG TPA: ABC transporter ATP-binding protein [Micromonosporaceae bacterium]|jgi:branched-chain amino acid transport system ATP-binding protein
MTSQSDGLRINAIGVRFGGLVALDDVSLAVAPGQIMGVIGPNGAGKTTLFNVVCGFVTPSAGDMTWDGVPLRPKPHRLVALGIGRTQQAVGLFGGLTVLENVMAGTGTAAGKRARFVGQLFGMPGSDRVNRRIRDTAMAHLKALDIAQYATELPGPLPFAIQKRVALARALIAEPRLLLLDEPASGLGADELEELATLIRGLPARAGRECSVMLVEHHMDLVMRVCDEITVLNFGRVIARGKPDEIRASAAVTDAYLGAEVTE